MLGCRAVFSRSVVPTVLCYYRPDNLGILQIQGIIPKVTYILQALSILPVLMYKLSQCEDPQLKLDIMTIIPDMASSKVLTHVCNIFFTLVEQKPIKLLNKSTNLPEG